MGAQVWKVTFGNNVATQVVTAMNVCDAVKKAEKKEKSSPTEIVTKLELVTVTTD